MCLAKNYKTIYKLFEAFHDLKQGEGPPDSRMVAGILFTITNEHLIDLLKFLLENDDARIASLALSKRSSLFDKLILIKGGLPKPWVIRLHTYQVPRGSLVGQRVSNLQEVIKDDEANTHFHRWQLGSRFLTGGFNNVTWDVREKSNLGGERQTRFGIPATARAGDSGQRTATKLGNVWVSERRSDFYMAGDVIAYPIVDAHSVSASMAPFVGTTMTFAHTGREILENSSFFKQPSEIDIPSVLQESFTYDEHIDAIRKAITRLELIKLNQYLANREDHADAFRHMNSFETELLPRIAELLVLSHTSPNPWGWRDWKKHARLVDLDDTSLISIAQMHSYSLAWLIISSQQHLFEHSFVSDVEKLTKYHREFEALSTRLSTGKVPQNARRF
ncbi:MAG: hypothetical protein ACJASL_002052 [Paraglaciecola sp.]|jgi:hypothetical protein